MNELRLRLSLLCAVAAFLTAAPAAAAVSGHRADSPPEADIYPVLRQGPGVDEQTVRDMLITGSIEKAFFGEDSLDAARVTIQTHNGHVHLSGTAPTDEARALAARLARETDNVIEVTNDIEIKADGPQ